MRFRIGDIVRIRKTFTTLNGESLYPPTANGKIIRIVEFDFHPIKVKFDGVDYGESLRDCSKLNESELKLVRRG